MDWTAWHDQYDTSLALMARPREVRALIARCLDACPPGPLRVISVCAGDGRDLIGALAAHPRAADVEARLVEGDAQLVERGRAAADDAGLAERIGFVLADATRGASYEGFAPAAIVLACGVFGNIRLDDTERLVASLGWLAAPDGFVIWTRGLGRGGAAHARRIREAFRAHAFDEVAATTTADGVFLVAAFRHRAPGQPPPDRDRLFEFVRGPKDLEMGLVFGRRPRRG